MDWDYWGKPVTGYGDTNAKLLIIGLAPAAHGGNRTGRVFTGDKSAYFLFKCVYEVGLSNQPNSDSLDDGLELFNCYMTPMLKCVPPQDKPKPDELNNCRLFIELEVQLLKNVKYIVALGKIAFDGYLKILKSNFDFKMKDFPFIHSRYHDLPNGKILISAYHPSPRNVNTKRLTFEMMVSLLNKIKNQI